MLRLFVGLKISEELRSDLAPLLNGLEGARWVRLENLHVTLRFIGEVEEDVAEDIDAALAGVAQPAFDVAFSGIDCFASRGRARALWTGVRDPAPVAALHAKIDHALIAAGLEPEGRKFTAHLTLARFRRIPVERLGPYLEVHGGFAAGPFPAREFTLFQSHLGAGGANYEALADYDLL